MISMQGCAATLTLRQKQLDDSFSLAGESSRSAQPSVTLAAATSGANSRAAPEAMNFLRRAAGAPPAPALSETEEIIGRILKARNHFEVMDIPVCPCAPAIVKKLYRKLALKVHPDKCSHADGERAFKRLSEAHEALSDERAQRDALGAARDEKMARDAAGVRQRRADTEAARREAERAREAEAAKRAFQQRQDDEKRRRDKADARAAKAEREERRKREAAEAEARAARERDAREQAERDERRREKKALQRAKRRLRAALDALAPDDDDDDDDEGCAPPPVSAEDVDELCARLETAALEEATAWLLRGDDGSADALRDLVKNTRAAAAADAKQKEDEDAARRDARRAAAAAAAARRALDLLWAPLEDAALLRSARKLGAPAPETLAKAKGHANLNANWNAVADLYNTSLANDKRDPDAPDHKHRSADECKARFKEFVKAASAKARPAAPAPAADADDRWSLAQQRALEAALVEFPAGDFKENPKDRWRAIAGGVDGKTAKLCLLRYKALAAAVKAKQGA